MLPWRIGRRCFTDRKSDNSRTEEDVLVISENESEAVANYEISRANPIRRRFGLYVCTNMTLWASDSIWASHQVKPFKLRYLVKTEQVELCCVFMILFFTKQNK